MRRTSPSPSTLGERRGEGSPIQTPKDPNPKSQRPAPQPSPGVPGEGVIGLRTADLDFDLPPQLIAQEPTAERAASRLLHYRRADRSVTHRTFSDLPSLLRRGDLLVFNDARVLPARFMLRKETGGLVEALFLSQPAASRWRVLLKNLASHGTRPLYSTDDPALAARVVASADAGEHEIEVST